MEKQIDLVQYGRDIMTYKDLPAQLDDINLKLAGWYAYYSAQIIPLELAEARFWEDHKDYKADKPKSDSFVKALWRLTVDGQKMIEYERVLKTLEKLMSSLRSSLARHDRELRTTYAQKQFDKN